MTSLANVSAASRNTPPPSALSGTKTRWSAPVTSLSVCGTTSPTKAMVPEKATAVPVIRDAVASSAFRVSPTRTPRARASSSLTINRFRSRERSRATTIPNSTNGMEIRTSAHLDASSPPASQKIISRCASRLLVNRMIADITAAMKALMATPASRRAAMEKRPPTDATMYTSARAPAAPVKDMAGSASGNRAWAPIAIATTAPRAPPVDTPIMPGSAIGLRNSPCITAPETPSADPTTSASMIRGSLMETIIACSVSGAVGSAAPICANRMSMVWEGGMVYGPTAAAVMTSTIPTAIRGSEPSASFGSTGERLRLAPYHGRPRRLRAAGTPEIGLSLSGRRFGAPESTVRNRKIPAALMRQGLLGLTSLLHEKLWPGLSRSLDEERPLSPTRQVSWLPDHRLSRAFPSSQ